MKCKFLTGMAVVTVGFAVLTSVTSNGQSFSATFDFANVVANTGGATDPTPVPTATGVTFGSFTSVGLSTNPNASSRFSFTTNATGAVASSDDFSTFTGSLNLGKYFEVTLTPSSGFTLDLNTISFTIQRSGTGIRSYAIRSSADGFAANLPASISPANANLTTTAGNEFRWVFDAITAAQNGSLITLGTAFDSLTAPETFRFYGWNAEATTGTFSVDNVVFSGTVTPVPEPSAMTLGMLGLGLAWALRRRTSK